MICPYINDPMLWLIIGNDYVKDESSRLLSNNILDFVQLNSTDHIPAEKSGASEKSVHWGQD